MLDNQEIIYAARYPEDRVNAAALPGVRRYASMRGWNVRVLDWDEALSRLASDSVSNPDAAGVVLECSDMSDGLPRAIHPSLRTVCINCPDAAPGFCAARFCTDNEAVARTAFLELAAGRPSAMACAGAIFGPRHWADARVGAFRALAAKAEFDTFSFAFRGDGGDRSRLEAWVAALPRHTAVFAVNDETAARVADAARATFRAIPQDLALLGVDDDISICEASHPTITSIRMDFENLGYLAAKSIGRAAERGRAATRPISIGPLLTVRRKSTSGRGRRDPHVLEAVARIRREACEGVTAEEIIAHFPGSKRLFTLRFREAMGHSVHAEIESVRLQGVCTLLADTDTPMDVIADSCGFGTGRALRKLFRLRFGMSMTEWRQKHGRR